MIAGGSQSASGFSEALRVARLTRWLAVLLGAALAGCSGIRAPSVEVVGARFGSASEEALRLDVDLDLVNPNAEPIELKHFTYTVTIDGRRMFSGRRAAQATLSAGGDAQLVLPAIVRFDAIGWEAADRPVEAEWSINGSLVYLTPGALAEILLDTRFREPKAGFRGRGSVALR